VVRRSFAAAWPPQTLIEAPEHSDADDAEAVRMFSTTCLGTFVSRLWRRQPVPLRAGLHERLVRAGLTCPPRCARRLLAVLADTAKVDYPSNWPGLLTSQLLPAAASALSGLGAGVPGPGTAEEAAGARLERVLLALHAVLKGTSAVRTPRGKAAHRHAAAESSAAVAAVWLASSASLVSALDTIVARAVEAVGAAAPGGPASIAAPGSVGPTLPAAATASALAPLAAPLRRVRLSCKCLRRCVQAGAPATVVPPPDGGPLWPSVGRLLRSTLSAHRVLWCQEAEDTADGAALTIPGAGGSWELLDNACGQAARLLDVVLAAHPLPAAALVGPLVRLACETLALETDSDPAASVGLPPDDAASPWTAGPPLARHRALGRPVHDAVALRLASILETAAQSPLYVADSPPAAPAPAPAPPPHWHGGPSSPAAAVLAGAFATPSDPAGDSPSVSAEAVQAARLAGPAARWLLSGETSARVAAMCIAGLMPLPAAAIEEFAADPSAASELDSHLEARSARGAGISVLGSLTDKGGATKHAATSAIVAVLRAAEAAVGAPGRSPLWRRLAEVEAAHYAVGYSAWSLNRPSYDDAGHPTGGDALPVDEWFGGSLAGLLAASPDALPAGLAAQCGAETPRQRALASACWPLVYRRAVWALGCMCADLGAGTRHSALRAACTALGSSNAAVSMEGAVAAGAIAQEMGTPPAAVDALLHDAIGTAFASMARSSSSESRSALLDCLRAMVDAASDAAVRSCAVALVKPLPQLWAACTPHVQTGVLRLLGAVLARVPAGAGSVAPSLAPLLAAALDPASPGCVETAPDALVLAGVLLDFAPDPVPDELLALVSSLPALASSDASLGDQIAAFVRGVVLRGGEGALGRHGASIAALLRGTVVDGGRRAVEAAVRAADTVMAMHGARGAALCGPVLDGALATAFTGRVAASDAAAAEAARAAAGVRPAARADRSAPRESEELAGVRNACLSLLARAAATDPGAVAEALRRASGERAGSAAAALVDAWLERADEVSAAGPWRRKVWGMALAASLGRLLPAAAALEAGRFEGVVHAVAGLADDVRREERQLGVGTPGFGLPSAGAGERDWGDDAASVEAAPPSEGEQEQEDDDFAGMGGPGAALSGGRLAAGLAARAGLAAGETAGEARSYLAAAERALFLRDPAVGTDLAAFARERLGELSASAGDAAMATACARVPPRSMALLMGTA